MPRGVIEPGPAPDRLPRRPARVPDGLDAALARILETAIEIAGADAGHVRLIDPATGALQIAALRGIARETLDLWDREATAVCALATKRRARVVVDDIDGDPRAAALGSSDILRQAGIRTLQATPIIDRSGTLLGTCATHWRVAGSADDRSLRLLDLLVPLAADAIAHAAAAAALAAARHRQEFLAALEETLRPLADPAEIEYQACRLLAGRLEADRAYFVAMDEAAGSLHIARDFVRDDAISIAGTHRAADYAWSLPTLRRGECLVLDDIPSSPLVPDADRPTCAALGIVACIDAPLILAGRFVGALCVTDSRARRWDDAEIGLVRDVGARIQAAIERSRSEAARRSGEALFRTLFERSPVGIAIATPDGRLVDCNAAFAELVGQDRVALRGRDVSGLLDPADRGAGRDDAGSPLDPADEPVRKVDRLLHVAGRSVWVDMSVRTMPGTGQLVVMAADITARRLADRDRARAQRLEAIGQLVGGIAHDVNNLLTTLSLNLEMAQMRAANDDQRIRIASAMSAVERGEGLTRRLVGSHRRHRTAPARSVPNDRIRQIAPMLRRSLGAKIDLAVTLAPEAWAVEIDDVEIDSAILNLALNARDAMADGGRLAIIVENAGSSEPDTPLAGPSAGAHVRLTIADTGTGMTSEVLRRATEPFFTTKPAGHGTGLGLSSVRDMVGRSGGDLDIASTAGGGGTTVTLRLPRAAARGRAGGRAGRPAERGDPRRRRAADPDRRGQRAASRRPCRAPAASGLRSRRRRSRIGGTRDPGAGCRDPRRPERRRAARGHGWLRHRRLGAGPPPWREADAGERRHDPAPASRRRSVAADHGQALSDPGTGPRAARHA